MRIKTVQHLSGVPATPESGPFKFNSEGVGLYLTRADCDRYRTSLLIALDRLDDTDMPDLDGQVVRHLYDQLAGVMLASGDSPAEG